MLWCCGAVVLRWCGAGRTQSWQLAEARFDSGCGRPLSPLPCRLAIARAARRREGMCQCDRAAVLAVRFRGRVTMADAPRSSGRPTAGGSGPEGSPPAVEAMLGANYFSSTEHHEHEAGRRPPPYGSTRG